MKGGVNVFIKVFVKEFVFFGVIVNVVVFGVVQIFMLNYLDQDELKMLEEEILVGRFVQFDEIFFFVYFFVLLEFGYINGQIISLNGGWFI